MAEEIANELDIYDRQDNRWDQNQRDSSYQQDSLNNWARQQVNIVLDHMPGLSIDLDIETQQDKEHMIANQRVNILQ